MPNNSATRDVLVSVIKTLQDRIKRDHATGRNETRTRTVLIDPVVDGLGWSDPSLSTSEYSIGYGHGRRIVDYALHLTGHKGRPIAFVEAKRLREVLTHEHLDQVLRYASKRNSVRYVGLTNGDRWQFHERLEDDWSLILDLSVRDESAFHCATQLVWFKRLIEGLEDVEDFEGMGDLELTEETGQTLYHYLGLGPSASPEEIRKAYRRKIRQVHPDVSADETANKKAQRTIEAYSVLQDPIKRSEYDRELEAGRAARQETMSGTRRPAPPRPPPRHRASSSARSERHSYADPDRAADVSTVISWSVFSIVFFGIIGDVIGFRAAQPVLEGFPGKLGALVVGTLVSVGAGAILLRLPWWRLSLGWLWSGEMYVKRRLIWSCGGLVGCGLLGGLLGYFLGFERLSRYTTCSPS